MGDEEEITFLMVQRQNQFLSVCANGLDRSRTLAIVKDAADNEIAGVIKTYREVLCLHHNLMQISSGVEYALLGVLSVM